MIICAPEYNGSTPSIVTNTISWISVTTDYWRGAFLNKTGLIEETRLLQTPDFSAENNGSLINAVPFYAAIYSHTISIYIYGIAIK